MSDWKELRNLFDKINKNRIKKYKLWCGDKKTNKEGYISIWKPEHPNLINSKNSSNGYISEHRFIMEQKLNRALDKKEIVHHINGVKNDNRPENLMLFNSSSEHTKYHAFLRKLKRLDKTTNGAYSKVIDLLNKNKF